MIGSRSVTSRVEYPQLVGEPAEVPLVQGGSARYVNLDNAASTSSLLTVERGVGEFMPWYSSVHRGAGFKSHVASAAYDQARERVRAFAGGRADDHVIFTRNTTDGLNLVSHILPTETTVIVSAMEHHANLLPWRRLRVCQLPVPTSSDAALSQIEVALKSTRVRPALVAVSGASNVTGELWPIAETVAIARRYEALVLVDAAQLAPHHPLEFEEWGIDFLAFSGHKLYAPYGAGALIGRRAHLNHAEPYLWGGGAVEFVTLDEVIWKDGEERHEAGSPNVVGAIAMGIACRELQTAGLAQVAKRERDLLQYARERLARVAGITLYSTWPWSEPRIGVLTFNLEGYNHYLLSMVLSAEHAVATRAGCFCAHPLVMHLMGVAPNATARLRDQMLAGEVTGVPGAVRASFGLSTTSRDIESLAEALESIAMRGHQWRYKETRAGGGFVPSPDPRSVPSEIRTLLD